MFTSSRTRLFDGRPGPGEAIVVSFFGGDAYYGRCAERLAAQCDQFGLAYDICEYQPDPGESWVNICRRKVAFYAGKLREHGSPVMWLDIDTQIIADPRRILGATADMGAFLRNFRPLVGFDPMQFARLLHPGYLLFSHTPRTLDFLAAMEALDRTADPAGTDDFLLEEALRSHGAGLSVQIFSPGDIAFSNEARDRGGAVFQHGDSGNVRTNIAVATQHETAALTLDRQKRVLSATAETYLKAKSHRDAAPFVRRILELDPDDAPTMVRYLKICRELGWKKKYAELVAAAEANPLLAQKVLRYRYEAAVGEGLLDRAADLAERIFREGTPEDQAFAESRQYRLSFDVAAQARDIPVSERVRLWWWERPYPGNLGDMINPWIVEGLTGLPPKFTNRSPRVLAIGSIIKFARPGDQVWGAGCPAADQVIAPGATFHAVRGPLTRQMVRAAGGDCPPVYGDPAWLLPLLHPDRKAPKTHRVGLIRHFTHRAHPIALGDDVREIEIVRSGREGIVAFLDEMLACEAIVSTSLHGLIIANAYGIPARLASVSASDRQIHGDGMKFEDYFLSIGRKGITPLDLSGMERLSGAVAGQCRDNPERGIDLDALLAAAPFAVSPEVLARRPQPGIASRFLQRLGFGAA